MSVCPCQCSLVLVVTSVSQFLKENKVSWHLSLSLSGSLSGNWWRIRGSWTHCRFLKPFYILSKKLLQFSLWTLLSGTVESWVSLWSFLGACLWMCPSAARVPVFVLAAIGRRVRPKWHCNQLHSEQHIERTQSRYKISELMMILKTWVEMVTETPPAGYFYSCGSRQDTFLRAIVVSDLQPWSVWVCVVDVWNSFRAFSYIQIRTCGSNQKRSVSSYFLRPAGPAAEYMIWRCDSDSSNLLSYLGRITASVCVCVSCMCWRILVLISPVKCSQLNNTLLSVEELGSDTRRGHCKDV